MRDLCFGLIGLVLGAGIMGGIWGIVAAAGTTDGRGAADGVKAAQTTLAKATDKCEIEDGSRGVSIGKDSIAFSAIGKSYLGVSMDDAECVLDDLDIPSSVLDKMGQTRALDGRQEDSWGSFKASWTYHPDDGMNLVVEVQDAPSN